MEQIQRYKIAYTETAILDMEEKADYIAIQLRDPVLRNAGICGCGRRSNKT